MATVKNHYQHLIIGFGKGGKTLAAWLSANGQEVAIIEQSAAMYGGTCINIACIPTKSLVTSAARGLPYPEAHAIKDQLTAILRQKNYDKIAQSEHGIVIDGKARFTGPKTLEVVTEAATHRITADRIFINTGTRPHMPDIPGIHLRRIYNSTTLMELSEKPKHLIVVGGGYVGLEFAAMFLKYGSRVTLIDHNKTFLPQEDPDMAAAIRQDLEALGLTIIAGAKVTAFTSAVPEEDATELTVHYKAEAAAADTASLTADGVLIATGRRPVTEDLNLQAAEIMTDAKGYIKVNHQLLTTAENVWAIGDVNGGPQFTYISLDDYRIIKNQLSNGPYNSLAKRKAYATAVFIEPPYARIGLNETEASAAGLEYIVFKLPAAAIPKASILRQKEGLLKAIVDKNTGKLLGCMIYAAEAHEIINIVQIAMHAGLRYEDLRDNIFTHPTMAEAFNDLFKG